VNPIACIPLPWRRLATTVALCVVAGASAAAAPSGAALAGPAVSANEAQVPARQAQVLMPPSSASTRPVAQGRFEDRLLSGSTSSAGQPAAGAGDPAQRDTLLPSLQQVVIALGTVIGLILLLRWGGKRLFHGAAARTSSRAVHVLCRSAVLPRQQVLLVQVGRRIIVAANNGTQLSALAEISDPDEVAELVGQIQSDRPDSVSRTFGALFRRGQQDYDPAADRGADPMQPPDAHDRPAGEDSSLHAGREPMRAELAGLMDKVRLLARQLGR